MSKAMERRDGYDLERFVRAQEGVHEQACAELRAGRKRTHWMWFIFPQIKGLGSSEMAMRYAIASIEEAKAYLEHPVLGSRLRECTQTVLDVKGKTAEEIFGYPDNLKFHSSMTLFAQAAEISEEDLVFSQALDKYFEGKEDAETIERL
jgi:uncharacterized protein (DUF1810 family)